MDIVVSKTKEGIQSDVLFLPIFQDRRFGKITSEINKELKGLIDNALKLDEFSGELGKFYNILYNSKIKRIVLTGLGKEKEFSKEKFRKAVGNITRYARGLKAKKIAVCLENVNFKAYDLGFMCAEGLILGNYSFEQHKTKERDKITYVGNAVLITDEKINEGIEEGKIVSESVLIARDLVNTPSMIKVPVYIAEKAKKICSENKISFKVFYKNELKKMGMNALLAVNAGSVNEPAFLVMEYNPKGKDKIAVVGKGITFDSGGLGIKPANYMKDMKEDMSGAASVIALMRVASLLKLKQNIIGIAPLTENMPGNNAYKPGDIIKAYNGKTIEIQHTDAEGRVILADGLSYASKIKPKTIIDLATLTGAIVVTLGDSVAGIMGNDKFLINNLIRAGEESGERLWELPMYDEYAEMIKSDVADVKNIGGWEGKAGSITGAMMLKEFVDEGIKWAHLDIAGTAMSEKDDGYLAKGATGFGVRLLVEYLKRS
ncbi:MAG: leucyl aminopeptidase [Nanoarchaeota archaeon]